jgi:hypothetical protein
MEMQKIMEMLVEMKATADAEREEMKAYQEDLLARMNHQTKYLLSHINQSMQNLPEATKIEQDPGMMQSVEEH